LSSATPTQLAAAALAGNLVHGFDGDDEIVLGMQLGDRAAAALTNPRIPVEALEPASNGFYSTARVHSIDHFPAMTGLLAKQIDLSTYEASGRTSAQDLFETGGGLASSGD
jgi:hypothetical protein